jgi:inner membrane protein
VAPATERDILMCKAARWRNRLEWLPRAGRLLADDAAVRWAAPVALGVIGGLDLIAGSKDWHLAVIGVLDEPAHLVTAGLVLALLPRGFASRVGAWALAASVAIDLDHLPLYTFAPGFATEGGRPPTHSLVTVLVLLVGGALAPKWRAALAGIATGVVLHFLRDVGTGPGVSLGWPIFPQNVKVPYSVYFGAMAAVTGLVIFRRRFRAHQAGTPCPQPASAVCS